MGPILNCYGGNEYLKRNMYEKAWICPQASHGTSSTSASKQCSQMRRYVIKLETRLHFPMKNTRIHILSTGFMMVTRSVLLRNIGEGFRDEESQIGACSVTFIDRCEKVVSFRVCCWLLTRSEINSSLRITTWSSIKLIYFFLLCKPFDIAFLSAFRLTFLL